MSRVVSSPAVLGLSYVDSSTLPRLPLDPMESAIETMAYFKFLNVWTYMIDAIWTAVVYCTNASLITVPTAR
jgi:hypothetical protein